MNNNAKKLKIKGLVLLVSILRFIINFEMSVLLFAFVTVAESGNVGPLKPRLNTLVGLQLSHHKSVRTRCLIDFCSAFM